MTRSLAALAILAATVVAGPARAEGPTSSMSVWRIEGAEAEVRAWVPVALARRFGATGETDAPGAAESFARAGLLTGDYLARRLVLSTASGSCEPVAGGPARGVLDGEWIVHSWRVRCPEATGWRLRDDAFFEDAPTHAHFARVWLEGGGEPIERVLTAGARMLVIGEPGSPISSATAGERSCRFAPLGVALVLAVLASSSLAGASLRGALAAVVGLALGAFAPGAHGAGAAGAALAILAVVVTPLARTAATRMFGAALLAACGGFVAIRGGSAGSLQVALGIVGLAVAASRAGRRGVGIVEAAAGWIVASTLVASAGAAAGSGLALAERAWVVGSMAAPLALVAAAARVATAPRWVPDALAASIVAVTLAWIGLGAR